MSANVNGSTGKPKGLAERAKSGLALFYRRLARVLLRRPMKFQTAALCYRTRRGRTEVLLITSRGTGRWVIPKGWLMSGKSASEAAAVEAWEEAGVKHGEPAGTPIGSFIYAKILKNGLPLPVEARVFPIEVRELADDYPEAHQRARRWVEPAEAAGMVDEPDLRQLLRDFTAPRCEERRETPEGG